LEKWASLPGGSAAWAASAAAARARKTPKQCERFAADEGKAVWQACQEPCHCRSTHYLDDSGANIINKEAFGGKANDRFYKQEPQAESDDRRSFSIG
jgi:hypothetical protein